MNIKFKLANVEVISESADVNLKVGELSYEVEDLSLTEYAQVLATVPKIVREIRHAVEEPIESFNHDDDDISAKFTGHYGDDNTDNVIYDSRDHADSDFEDDLPMGFDDDEDEFPYTCGRYDSNAGADIDDDMSTDSDDSDDSQPVFRNPQLKPSAVRS